MNKILIVLTFLITFFSNTAQEKHKKNASKAVLQRWTTEECDKTYDPDRLVNRITHFESNNGITSITVNFSDNCCISFRPEIDFQNNKLVLLPYKELSGELCTCNCCFSINYEITGLETENFEVYFNNEKIELSDDHYRTIEPRSELYKGETINKLNKYGFEEGIWLSFYENGNLKSVKKYPESSLYFKPRPYSHESFYESGALKFKHKNDTLAFWFEDGEIKSEITTFSKGDTVFEKSIKKHDNRKIQERYLERRYPIVRRSEFNPSFLDTITIRDYLYKEEYFEDGRPKYIQQKDTSYKWFENGKIKFKSYSSGNMRYNEEGLLVEKSFNWKVPGTKTSGDLTQYLYVEYNGNGNIEKILFIRDEYDEIYKGFSPNVRYYWKWNAKFQLIESPKKWKEAFPWKKISEINQLLSKYELD